MEDYSEYSSKENYWYRRNAVEVFFKSITETIPNFAEKNAILSTLNHSITQRSETVIYKCVYLFRDGQPLNEEECDSRGGYADSWYRAHHYNLPFAEEDCEDNPPMPGEPVKVLLKPANSTKGFRGEYPVCWHPKCRESYTEDPFKSSPVIYMFCHPHAEKDRVKEVHDFCLKGTPMKNQETKDMVEEMRLFIFNMIETSLNSAIEDAKFEMASEVLPDKVLEIQCASFLNDEDESEEITYYVDRVSCITKQVELPKE